MRIIDEYTFKKVKGNIFWRLTPSQAAAQHDISLKTVLQIRGSKDYTQYRQQCKAQHPETEYSLGENVLLLHKLVFDERDNKYIPPPSARKAVEQLKLKFIKNEK